MINQKDLNRLEWILGCSNAVKRHENKNKKQRSTNRQTYIYINLQERQYYFSYKFKISGKKKLSFLVKFRLASFTNYFFNCKSTILH